MIKQFKAIWRWRNASSLQDKGMPHCKVPLSHTLPTLQLGLQHTRKHEGELPELFVRHFSTNLNTPCLITIKHEATTIHCPSSNLLFYVQVQSSSSWAFPCARQYLAECLVNNLCFWLLALGFTLHEITVNMSCSYKQVYNIYDDMPYCGIVEKSNAFSQSFHAFRILIS